MFTKLTIMRLSKRCDYTFIYGMIFPNAGSEYLF